MSNGSGRRSLSWVMATAAAASAAMAVHAAYGARRYNEPSLYHVIALSLAWLVLTVALSGLYVWRPRGWTRWVLVVLVGLAYVANFGVLHGGVGHGLKLIAYASGTTPERLGELFDFGDFVVPDDAFFEASGVATFLAGLAVAYGLLRFVRTTRGT